MCIGKISCQPLTIVTNCTSKSCNFVRNFRMAAERKRCIGQFPVIDSDMTGDATVYPIQLRNPDLLSVLTVQVLLFVVVS